MVRSLLWVLLCVLCCPVAMAQQRPNILWITSEDNGPHLGCYGDAYADTPNIDALAEKSLRYRRCWSNAPVCAPARTTLIAGMYATSLGGHHMRSGVKLPKGMNLYPQVLRDAGYYCTNNSKTDYNFANADAGWHESSRKAHWRNRPNADTPFFAIFNFTVSHESRIRRRPHELKHDPAEVRVPAYHPDTPEVRRDWAQYYDKITEMDAQVGEVLKELQADGLADSTIIFYYGDHGSGMPRSKRWPFDSGLRVPLLMHIPARFAHLAPEEYQAGGESTRLVSFVDLGPTVINMAGAARQPNMQGRPFAGPDIDSPQPYIFGYRGRMDERIDMVRCMTDGRYLYMRHFYPDRPYLKHVEYMFQTPTTQVWKNLFDEGKLNEAQAKFWQTKPVEELYDLQKDPDEVNNLAGQPKHRLRVAQFRRALKAWMRDTQDMGVMPEAEMHRLVEDSPRQYGRQHRDKFKRWVDVAFEAMDSKNGASLEQLVKWSGDSDSIVRFWAARGLAVRPGDGGTRDQALAEAVSDESPSVAIAACDGLLKAKDPQVVAAATERLIELANVEKVGHFAAIAALNVLDMNAELDAETRAQIDALPRKVDQPPPRLGGYVPKLIDHITQGE